MMKPPGAATHTETVREILTTIAAQAKAALAGTDKPGLLQLSRLHPASETLVSSRFVLDDVEHMIEAAVIDSEAGHNVYIEGRTVRADLRGNTRGSLTDTVGVFALVVDSDADTGKSWTPTMPVSMTVETSPGNFQFWFFLREAISPERAQKLGERIRAATRADHDSGNPTQPYRVAGTINYPSPKKTARGRVTVPTWLMTLDLTALWAPEDIEAAFPIPEHKTDGGTVSAGSGTSTTDEANIPDDTMREIRGPVIEQGRGPAFFNVVRTLKEDGWTADAIVALLERYPDGVAKKFRGRLRREVERVYSKIKDGPTPRSQPQQRPVKIASAQELETMSFNPIKYVVPGIFVEGLTLLAGKPKIGKSWLLLHTALAVARGGFTLGELHCIEGDVLYCALEDNERRLQSRITKLLNASQGWPKRLSYCCELPRLGDGGAEHIRNWIMSVPHPRLVVIDTLAMVRALKKIDESNYQSDYLALLELRELANEFGIAIPVSHHLRKAEADDPFDTISGTLGLTGAVDSMLVLKRDGWGGYTLHGKGRDLIEIEKALTFDRETCIWRIAGEAVAVRRSAERTAILDAVAEAKEPIGPGDIATAAGMKAGNVRFLLHKLMKDGAIEKAAYGRYAIKGANKPSPVSHFRIIGECEDQTICVKCGQPGNVKRIMDSTRPGSQSETLHEACAEVWFAAV
jgi:AAA domain-containing protein/IclR-like helix-turn-helix domain-containing protein